MRSRWLSKCKMTKMMVLFTWLKKDCRIQIDDDVWMVRGGYFLDCRSRRSTTLYRRIAGATVPDPIDQVNYYRNSLNRQKDSRQAQEQLNMWVDSVSPIKEVSKVNIPMLIVHGDVDQRTPPRAARKYMKALKKHDKDHKVLALEGADHFSDTLFYHHKIELYTAMTDYLANDCSKNSNKVAQR